MLIIYANIIGALLLLAFAGCVGAYYLGSLRERVRYEKLLEDVWKDNAANIESIQQGQHDAVNRSVELEGELQKCSRIVDDILVDVQIPAWDDETKIGIRVKDLSELAKATERFSRVEGSIESFRIPAPTQEEIPPSRVGAKAWRCPCGLMHQFYETKCRTCSMSRPMPHASAE